MIRWLSGLAAAAALVAGGWVAAAPPTPSQTGPVRWLDAVPLSGADGVDGTIWRDPGLDCATAWGAIAAPDASLEAVVDGFADGLRAAGGTVEPTAGDGSVRFVLGRYRGDARLSLGDDRRAEVTVCFCSDRYPEEASAACDAILQ